MLKQLTASLLLSVTLLSAAALAQDQGPTPEEQAARDQMQTMFQTIMQNMQDKGIDPATFFQQMRSGTDPAEIQKQLIDQGIIDQKMIDQMQSSMQAVQSSGIKRQLNATDDEWKVLWPLIQKVLTAQAAVNGNRGGGGGMGMGMGFMSGQSADSDLSKADRALQEAIKDPATGADRFASVLADYRAAKAKAQADLASARHDLQGVVTVRQEGILTTLGILE